MVTEQMTADAIVAQAQRELVARQTAAIRRRWGARERVLLALVALVLVAFVVAPGALPQKLLAAMRGVCALRPSHSYFVGGLQLPLEARTTGIYGGFLVTLMAVALYRPWGARRLYPEGTRRGTRSLLVLLFLSMVGDGINSTVADMGLAPLYTLTNGLRLTTGLASGAVMALVFFWLLGRVALPRVHQHDTGLARGPRDLLLPALANAAFAAAIIDGRAPFYYPIALVTVAGVVAAVGGVFLLLLVSLGDLSGRVTRLRELISPGAAGVLLAFTLLGVLAASHSLQIPHA